jgi:hypothetical protein
MCVPIAPDAVDWDALDASPERSVFQTREWLAFLAEAQNAAPLIAGILHGQQRVGTFTGLVFSRFGVRILGSPFPGWTTPYIGFNVDPGISRGDALQAVERLAFGSLRCLHMEIADLHMHVSVAEKAGFRRAAYDSYRTDLTASEEQLFSRMRGSCRRCIRKAEACGVLIEEASDAGFADEYYAQLVDVFQKQALVPSYGPERVRCLIKHLLPTGRLLLLRARAPDGRCIATGIYPGMGDVGHLWGNASWRDGQHMRPNEALNWYAMRYWKSRGAASFDWGGLGSYKEKYGAEPMSVPWVYKSRVPLLSSLRDEARRMFYRGQRFAGRVARTFRRQPAVG